MQAIIETERLILREFSLNDVEAVYAFASNDAIHQYTGDKPTKSKQGAREIITDVWFQDYQKYGYGRWALIYKPEAKIIGFAGLKYLPELNETDIGYRFLPQYWGKGIGTEAAREIIQYGFERLSLERIIGIAFAENIASWKILEKAGLRFYQESSYEGSEEKLNWYKIEREDYFEIRP